MESLEEENIIKDIRNLFRQEKKTKEKVFSMKKKNTIISQKQQVIFGVTIMLNMKVTMIEIEHYQLKNFLIKLHHI